MSSTSKGNHQRKEEEEWGMGRRNKEEEAPGKCWPNGIGRKEIEIREKEKEKNKKRGKLGKGVKKVNFRESISSGFISKNEH